MWMLALMLKEGKERSYPLRTLPQVIGSESDSQIRITHESVAPAHVRFFERGDELWCADLGSDAGTLLNGRSIDQAALRTGDKIQVGAAQFQVRELKPQAAKGMNDRKAAPRNPTPGKAGQDAPGVIRHKQEILQFNRREARPGGSILRGDFSQVGGGFRLMIILILAVIAVGIFFGSKWLIGLIL